MDICRLTLNGRETVVRIVPERELLPAGQKAPDCIVADSNTALILPEENTTPLVIVPAGEACKELSVLEQLLAEFVRLGLRRDSSVAALGGGAVTDLAAFAASIYLRGLEVVLIPSSLLAMVDAAIGGKTGIDFRGHKNMVGTFFPAREVRIEPGLLRTLSEREVLSGLAEVIKAALIGDPQLLDILERQKADILARDRSVMAEVIRRSVMVKCGIVSRDFTEQGERAFLNLGHTFGHALESCLGFGIWTHGEAVAWGIARALETGLALGITEREWAERVLALLSLYGYPVSTLPVPGDRILAAMEKDKKRKRDGIGFILQTGPFTTVQQRVDSAIILRILDGEREVLR